MARMKARGKATKITYKQFSDMIRGKPGNPPTHPPTHPRTATRRIQTAYPSSTIAQPKTFSPTHPPTPPKGLVWDDISSFQTQSTTHLSFAGSTPLSTDLLLFAVPGTCFVVAPPPSQPSGGKEVDSSHPPTHPSMTSQAPSSPPSNPPTHPPTHLPKNRCVSRFLQP